MISLRVPRGGIFSLWLCLGLTGCFPSGGNPVDEQKEPHFLTGKQRNNSMDYKGAIESFEKALEANPRSGSAHFELALLYEQKENDYASAIYHYEKFVRLHPQSSYAERATERINVCKQALAQTVSIGPISPNLQRDLDRLHALEAENTELKRRLATFEARSPMPTNPPIVVASLNLSSNLAVPSPGRTSLVRSNLSSNAQQTMSSAVRTHAVKGGETPTAIAKQYGVTAAALMAANPGVDARRLRVGQSLNIPAR